MTSFLFKFLIGLRRWPTSDTRISLQPGLTHDSPQTSNRFASPALQSSAGFSLLEMIVIVVIVGILGALAAPSWLGLANRQRINTTRDEIVQTIRSSQGNAKQKRRTQNIEFKADGTDDLPTLDVDGLEVELGNGNLKADMVNMVIKDEAGTAITTDHMLTFDSDGTVATTIDIPFSIELTSDNSSYRSCIIVQTLLGNLRLESGEDCDVIDI